MIVFVDTTSSTIHSNVAHVFVDCSVWNYDGSSCYQARGEDSDTYLYPVAIYNDPFLQGGHKLVLCETYYKDEVPTGKESYYKDEVPTGQHRYTVSCYIYTDGETQRST